MEILKSRAFIADLYEAKNYKGNDTDFEVPKFDEVLIKKDVVLIQYGHVYVKAKDVNGLISDITYKFKSRKESSYYSTTFLHSDPNYNFFYIKNLRPLGLSEVAGKYVSLGVLHEFQDCYDLHHEQKAKYEEYQRKKAQELEETKVDQ